jgi:hypothetical protein
MISEDQLLILTNWVRLSAMIFLARDSWLSEIVAVGVLVAVGGVAFVATLRRGWKAWPILLASTLLLPVVAFFAVAVVLYYIDVTYGLAGGFVIHTNWLILTILVPAVAGAGIGLAMRRHNAKATR